MEEPQNGAKEAPAEEALGGSCNSSEGANRETPNSNPRLWGERPNWFDILENKFQEHNVTDDWMGFIQAALNMAENVLKETPEYKEYAKNLEATCKTSESHKEPDSDNVGEIGKDNDDVPKAADEINTDDESAHGGLTDENDGNRSKEHKEPEVEILSDTPAGTHKIDEKEKGGVVAETHPDGSNQENTTEASDEKPTHSRDLNTRDIGSEPTQGEASEDPKHENPSQDSDSDSDSEFGSRHGPGPHTYSSRSTGPTQFSPAYFELLCKSAKLLFDVMMESKKEDNPENVHEPLPGWMALEEMRSGEMMSERTTSRGPENYSTFFCFGGSERVSSTLNGGIKNVFSRDLNNTNDKVFFGFSSSGGTAVPTGSQRPTEPWPLDRSPTEPRPLDRSPTEPRPLDRSPTEPRPLDRSPTEKAQERVPETLDEEEVKRQEEAKKHFTFDLL